ncbi:MAG: SOS response-associated peptidase [Pseudomonadota bacterium]
MPGRLFLATPIAEIAGLVGATCDFDELPRHNIAPGQEVVVLTAEGLLTRMRWGLIPVGRVNARGRPVMDTIVNARSETVFAKSAYEGVVRCAVPADGWYEWTGKKGRKTAWAIRAKSGAPLWFAAICDKWDGPGGHTVWQVATVTCEPNVDVRDIHDRMGVLLDPVVLHTWLTGSEESAAALMKPAPDGSLKVSEAGDVDWSGP